jgi:hypothetical protein
MEATHPHREFQFSGATTTDEMMRAYKLAWRDTSQMRWRYRGQIICYVLAILFGVIADQRGDYGFAVFFWTCAGVGFVSVIYCAIAFRKKVARHLKHGIIDDDVSRTFVDERGTRITDGKATLEIKWSKFVGFRHDNELAVVYIHYPLSFLAFFRRTLEPTAAWNDFISGLEQRLRAA